MGIGRSGGIISSTEVNVYAADVGRPPAYADVLIFFLLTPQCCIVD